MKKLVYLFSLLLLSFSSVSLAQTTYIVSSTNDDGPNTLREFITRINSGTDTAPYTINFIIAGPVSLTAPLPAITQSCTIIGFSALTPATASGGTTLERTSTAGDFGVLSFTGNGITVWLQDLILQKGATSSALLINASAGNVTINRCLIRNSSAVSGGGARIDAGTVTMNDSQFTNNTATNSAGNGFFGGALAISATTFTANRCTFTGNSARFGGAIDNYVNQSSFTNCTFSGNTSTSNGQVIYSNGSAKSDFIHCSFLSHLSNSSIMANEDGDMRFINCFIAGNGNRRFWFRSGKQPISLGGNVSVNTDDNNVLNQLSDKTGVTSLFGSLRQNTDGAVATHSIGDCSPAKDAGVTSSTALTIPTTDANNKPRSGAPDAGAFEVQVPTSVSLTAGNSGTITCVNQALTAFLSGGTSGTYTFAGPGLSTTTTSTTAIASQAGTYTVTVTSAEGCSVSATTSVFANTVTPGVSLSVTDSGLLTCNIPTITLTAGSPTAGVNFSFSSPGGSTQATNQITVNTAGLYSVTATNPQNGCASSTTASVTSSTETPGVSLAATNNGVIACGTQTLTLTASSSTTGTSFSFASANSFTTVGTSIVVNSAGTYSVTALNPTTGCYSTTSLTVSENLIPPGVVSISRTGAIGCGPNSVTLTASASGATSYSLLPGGTSNSTGVFVVTTAGTYTLIGSSGAGSSCQSQTAVVVSQGTNAVAGPITASGPASSGNPARLTATATGQSFVFTGPNGYVFSNVYRIPGSYSLFAPNVQTPGLYTLTVYGSPGCPPASSTVTVN